jgi:Ca2+-binding RTX toxin-like protein
MRNRWLRSLARHCGLLPARPGTARRAAGRFQPMVEGLEQRLLLTTGVTAALDNSGTLAVLGTANSDVIGVKVLAGTLQVLDDTSVAASFDATTVTSLHITSYGGNDSITIDSTVGHLPTRIDLGDGTDTVAYNGAGDCTVFGGAGDDAITGGSGHNLLYGVAGHNTLSGGLGSATIFGGSGSDSITGGAAGQNAIYLTVAPSAVSAGGGTGNLLDASAVTTGLDLDVAGFQTVYGSSGNDTLTDSGADDITIFSGTGNDSITGGSGHNVLYGGGGDDTLSGGGGSAIFGGSGADHITGGAAGHNRIYLYAVPISVRAGGGTDNLLDASAVTGNLDLDVAGFQTVCGGSGNDTLFDSGADDITIYGGSGNDSITGGSGHSVIHGGGGADTLSGGSGSATIFGDSSSDDITGGAAGDNAIYLYAAPAAVQAGGGTGNVLDASAVTTGMKLDVAGFQTVYGGSGNDTLTDSGTDDITIYGGAGIDSIVGGAGHNLIYIQDNTAQHGFFGCVLDSGNILMAQGTTVGFAADLTARHFQEVYGGDGGDTLTYAGPDAPVFHSGSGNDLFATLDTSAVFLALGASADFTATATAGAGVADIAWDFDYDGQAFHADAGAAGALTVSHSFSAPSNPRIALRVTDQAGATALVCLPLTVGLPDVWIESDSGDDTFFVGDMVNLTAQVDGDPSSYVAAAWDLNYDGETFHADANAHDLTVALSLDSPGPRTVAVRLTDAAGDQALATFDLTVENVPPHADRAGRLDRDRRPNRHAPGQRRRAQRHRQR